MNTVFTGSGVALVTPFGNDGKVNFESFRSLIEFQIENSTDALIICGTTGEASTLTDDEQVECIRFAVQTAAKRVPIIAGAGSNDTVHGAALAKRCIQAGADATLLVTPYYNKTSQKGLVEHYEFIAKHIDAPIIIYNVPARTGMNIAPKTLKNMSHIDNITGIKEASANIVQITEMLALCGDRFDIYSGVDELNFPILALGGKGIISVSANIIPKDTHDMIAKVLAGDFAGARQMHIRQLELILSLFVDVSPMPVKAALNLMGFDAGQCKMPLTTLETHSVEIIKKAMCNYGLLRY